MTWLPALICALLVGGSLGRFVELRPDDWKLSKTSPVKYVITGQKDANGHWTEQVHMEHGEEEDWHMEVDHMTLDVGEKQPKVKITATFSAKSKTNDVAVVPKDSSESAESGGEVPGTVFQLFPRSYDDWFGAQSSCKEWGGHLAIPDTREKMRQLTAILRKHVHDIGENTGAFLGFDDLKREGHFVTVLGKPLFNPQGTSWSPHWFQAGQPDDDKAWSEEGEDCGSMRPNGGINDVPCRYNLPYICEKSVEEAVDVEKAVDEEEASTSVADVVDKDENTLWLFRNQRLDWFQARLACVEWGGHLAIPDSEAKMLKMKEMLIERTITAEHESAFVGFSDIKEEGKFVTIFGEPVFDYGASWTPHWYSLAQPDDDKSWTTEGEDCGAVRPEGGLNDVPCGYMLPYFCERSSRVDDVTASTSGDDVSESSGDDRPLAGSEHLGLFTRDDLDWAGANEACEEWGGHLAIPDSFSKMEVMTLKMKLANVPAAFLGFSDQDQEGHFVTLFGKSLFNQPWSPHWWRDDQPDDDKAWFADGEDCGSIKSSGGLNDVPCRHHMPFFCEKSLAPAHSSDDATQDDYFYDSEESSSSTEESSSLVITNLPITHTDSPIALQTNVEEDELSSSSTEEALFQVTASIHDLPALSDSPIDAQRSEEDESSSSTEEALFQVTASIHGLPTLSDSPIDVQRSEEDESSSSTEEALFQVTASIHGLPTLSDSPIDVQRSEEDESSSSTEEALWERINTVQNLLAHRESLTSTLV